MPKITALLTILIFALGLSACGNTDTPQSSEPDHSSTILVEPPVQEDTESQERVVSQPAQIDVDIAEEAVEQLSPQEIRMLLDAVPYSGMNYKNFESYGDPIDKDETGIRIADFIAGMTGWWGWPSASFASPEEASPEYVFAVSFEATNWVQWGYPDVMEESAYHPELAALEPYLESVAGKSIKLHKHLEETARTLFGQELTIDPYLQMGLAVSGSNVLNFYQSDERFEIYHYSREAFGFGGGYIPIVLSYEEVGDGYEAICVFVNVTGGGDGYQYYDDATSSIIPQDALLDYLHTVPGKHNITLKTNPDGGLHYWSHILPSE